VREREKRPITASSSPVKRPAKKKRERGKRPMAASSSPSDEDAAIGLFFFSKKKGKKTYGRILIAFR
jgi:hypothetical protein